MVITIKFDKRLVVTSAIYLVLAIGIVLYTHPYFSVWLPASSSDLASWVQAVGSIAAIIATAFIARSDGLHRKLEMEKYEAREKRIAKFDLRRTSILSTLSIFTSTWAGYESSFRYKELPKHIHDNQELFFLNFTRDAFRNLEIAFNSISAENSERIFTGLAGDKILSLMRTVALFDHHYQQYDEYVKDIPYLSKRWSLFRQVDDAMVVDISRYNEEVCDYAQRIFSEKEYFFAEIKELNALIN